MNSLWGFIITSVGVAGVVGALYLVWTITKFPGIKKITKDKKVPKFLLSLAILAACFGIVCLTMSMINAVIVLIHFMLFRLIFGIAGFIIKKTRKKESSFYWQGWGAFGLCFVYLAIGYFLCNHVFVTTYDIETDKAVGNLKIVMFADSHVGTTFDGDGFKEQMERINAENPDLVLICGDLVDDGTDKENMQKTCDALSTINATYGVYYVYGNHDKGYYGANRRGYSPSTLEYSLLLGKVHVLEDKVREIADNIVIVGRADASNRGRKSIEDLTKDIDPEKFIIVLNHQPTDYDNEAVSNADLVLSGHTHGGQFFPFTLFGNSFGGNDRAYGHETRNGTDFIVTSGIADWELKFKTGTKSEYVVINIKGK
ncbi:MAG: metallophosphoesterase [Lachnospiraceae bacterium]|nr:metallophosphoesterase [Lachnospiraceae bacterium]